MKKTFLAVMMAGSVMAMAGMAHAADGTVKFVGNIIDTACTVDTASQDQTVPLGDVAASSFTSAGIVSTAQKFDVKLTNCPAGNVAVVFAGTSDAVNTDLLQLDSGMTAKGVGVRINNATDGTQVKVNDTVSPLRVTVDGSGAATLNYVGQYQSTTASVTAGTANATSQFTVLYN
ncbi:fimbrial protein [Lelliottia sp. V106_10]|uniref:fimbrial protein n=1 Tax=Lelliottia wanjuensis TaxID=3050585 RepID=UPI00254B499C|nr:MULTISPECIES: fimbrial protein [unclassified Lelliottia]MDK9358858.1 fimbrial protein [Lelliottia sp. V106_16]MDK9373545.1 fimbrial protein [Lelliottia sp. V106_10]MDK9600414.1 fimbrial protein [Lelliottia sp. V106_5]